MARADDDGVLFFLDSPKYHRIEFGRLNRFRGVILDSRDASADGVRASFDGREPLEFAADLPSEDIAAHVAHLPSARRCRFDFELFVPSDSRRLVLEGLDKSRAPLARLEYDLEMVRSSRGPLLAMATRLEKIPAPPPEVVFLTQGHADAGAYQDSIIPGIVNQGLYLQAAGIEISGIRDVLDLGCGSGRSLVGWYLDDPKRNLLGCDTNPDLIAWAKANLPGGLQFERTAAEPPLPCRAEMFDLVSVISVFTHLSFPSQERWAREIDRVLRPGGFLFLTTHGQRYVQLFAPDRQEEYRRVGHFEIQAGKEGSNDRASFHTPEAIGELFAGFDRAADFPCGWIGGKRILFPLASLQDVCVLKKRG
jgi:SAM-dependent methyltransferase